MQNYMEHTRDSRSNSGYYRSGCSSASGGYPCAGVTENSWFELNMYIYTCDRFVSWILNKGSCWLVGSLIGVSCVFLLVPPVSRSILWFWHSDIHSTYDTFETAMNKIWSYATVWYTEDTALRTKTLSSCQVWTWDKVLVYAYKKNMLSVSV